MKRLQDMLGPVHKKMEKTEGALHRMQIAFSRMGSCLTSLEEVLGFSKSEILVGCISESISELEGTHEYWKEVGDLSKKFHDKVRQGPVKQLTFGLDDETEEVH